MLKKHKLKALLFLIVLLQLFNITMAFAGNKILTSTEKAFLNDHGEIKMLVDDNYAPISYYDTENNHFAGIAVETMERLSKLLGFKYTIIKDDSLTWADKLNKIYNNEIDVLGGASVSDERLVYGYFTNEIYFKVNYAIIGSIDKHIIIKDTSDIAKYRIGLVKQTGINSYILENISPDTSVKYYDTMEAALAALKCHRVDIIADNEAVFVEKYFNEQRFDFEIVYSLHDIIKNYAFFTPKTDDGLKLSQILDKGMKEIDMDQIVGDRYQNKSIFAYYKDYAQGIIDADHRRTDIFVVLLFILMMSLTIIVFIKVRYKQLEVLANTDFLTRLKNRDALFSDYRKREQLDNKRVYFIDLDDFKFINDNYGHDAGDEVLRCISNRLIQFAPRANIYRLGGDEFLLITGTGEGHYGQTLLDIIKIPITYKQTQCKVGASIGYLETDNFTDLKLHEIINLADYAMLEAKANGKNSIFKVSFELIEKYKNILDKKL